jgi:hypothetical protein
MIRLVKGALIVASYAVIAACGLVLNAYSAQVFVLFTYSRDLILLKNRRAHNATHSSAKMAKNNTDNFNASFFSYLPKCNFLDLVPKSATEVFSPM